MKNNPQTVPVGVWEPEPELNIPQPHGGPPGAGGSTAKTVPSPAVAIRNQRREQEVLGWQIRLGRLVNPARRTA